MILDDIITQKRKDLEELKRRFPAHRLQQAVLSFKRSKPRDFKKAISAPHGVNLISEIKKASPSAGILREDFQPLRIANSYEAGGAAAISVLTEPHYFKGRPSYLRTVRQVTSLPILRKDFILESYQLYETALLEADAFLLIASILTDDELRHLIQLGLELKMEALVEVHADEDLSKALYAGARIIGINNRNLRTLEVDARSAKQLIPHVPKGIPIVIESGLQHYEEIMEYKSLGINAFLAGTVFMKSRDIVSTMNELLGRDRKWIKSSGGTYGQS